MIIPPSETVRARFFAPLDLTLNDAIASRRCSQFSDREHIESGVGRVLEAIQSGRDWVQLVRRSLNALPSVSVFSSRFAASGAWL